MVENTVSNTIQSTYMKNKLYSSSRECDEVYFSYDFFFLTFLGYRSANDIERFSEFSFLPIIEIFVEFTDE